MRSVAIVVALAACLHAGVWALLETRQVAPDVNKPLASVSYDSRPGGMGTRPTIAQMREDLRALAPYTRTIRTYSSTGGKLPEGPDQLPYIRLGVPAGGCGRVRPQGHAGHLARRRRVQKAGTERRHPDKRRKEAKDANEREIRSGIELARRHSNIISIVVGNETLYRGGLTVSMI